MAQAATELSRRALFGAGLTRLARSRLDAAAGEPAPAPAAAGFWAAGDYGRLARRYEPAADRLAAAMAPMAGDRFLDVAAGDGNLALAAARRGAEVVALDACPELVERGRARTQAAGAEVTWHVGDAGALPFATGQFDCVGSNFGVIHAADMRDAASELERVLRPGGRLGLATWSSTGAMGAVLRAARKAAGPAARRTRPERWGSYEGLYLALERFPGFDVSQPTLEWRYADRDALWHDLAEPPGPLSAAATDRTLVEERLAPFLRREAGALVLRVEWCLVLAVRPD